MFYFKIPDENGRVTYSLVSGVNTSRPEFGVFPDGSLYVAQKLDRETKVRQIPHDSC